MKLNSNKLRDAVCVALAASAASVAGTGVASAQTATNLDRIEVTGSRIRQASLETAQPVIALQRADIEKQGFTSVGDIVQNLSATGSPAISRADALTSGEEVGGQYVDLRGLGPERTLVLLDGKRMGVSTGGYTDLASIPTSVVERIEVLTDGASAIYGSDAIAGVVNIILRSDFQGAILRASYGLSGDSDGDARKATLTAGTGDLATDGWNAFFSLDVGKTDAIKISDRKNRKL